MRATAPDFSYAVELRAWPIGHGIPDIARLRPGVVTRSISPENPRARRAGAGGPPRAPALVAARDLGQGWKVSPSIEIAAHTTVDLAAIDGPGRITHIWLTTHPDHWRCLLLRARWDGAEAARGRGAGRRLLRPGMGPVRPALVVDGRGQPARRVQLLLADAVPRGRAPHAHQPVGIPDRRLLPGDLRDRRRRVGERLPARALAAVQPGGGGRCTRSSTGCAGMGQYVGTYLAWGSNSRGWWGEGEMKFYLDGDAGLPDDLRHRHRGLLRRRLELRRARPGLHRLLDAATWGCTRSSGRTGCTTASCGSACTAGTCPTRSGSPRRCGSPCRRWAGARAAATSRCTTTSPRRRCSTSTARPRPARRRPTLDDLEPL